MSPPVQAALTANGKGEAGGKSPVFKIFVGYDPCEDVAYKVCCYSILKRASIPVEVIPIKQSDLRSSGLYWRDRDPTESAQFSITRFLTPHLANFNGWAMFVDCDFLYLTDIKELKELIQEQYAFMCVQHDYTPKESTKMDGAVFYGCLQLWSTKEPNLDHRRGQFVDRSVSSLVHLA